MNPVHIFVTDSDDNIQIVANLPKTIPIPRVGEFLILPVVGSNSKVIATREMIVEKVVYDFFKQVTEVFCYQISICEIISPSTITNNLGISSVISYNLASSTPEDVTAKKLQAEMKFGKERLIQLETELVEKQKQAKLRLERFDRERLERQKQRDAIKQDPVSISMDVESELEELKRKQTDKQPNLEEFRRQIDIL